MAGGKGAVFADEVLALILNGDGIPNLAENASSSPLTNLYASLHIASPGATGSQNTNEAGYGGYARVALPRMSGGAFVVAGGVANPVASIIWPTATNSGSTAGSGSETEQFWAIGTAASGAGKILYWGPITPNILVTQGVPPQLTTLTAITES